MSSTTLDPNVVRLFNDKIDIILILTLCIPLTVLIWFLLTYIESKRLYTTWSARPTTLSGDTNTIDYLEKSVGKLNQRCKDHVLWVYSNRYLDPKYGLCNINTLANAYRWVVCKKSGVCKPVDEDPGMYCLNMDC